MNITVLDQQASGVFRNLRSDAARIRRRTKMLLDELSKLDSADTFVGNDGFGLTVFDEEEHRYVLAEYRSPVGRGRFVMTWTRDTENILGRVTFQVPTLNEKDQVEWMPKFDLMVPPQNTPFASTDADVLGIPIDNRFGNHLSNAVFDLHMAILGALTEPR